MMQLNGPATRDLQQGHPDCVIIVTHDLQAGRSALLLKACQPSPKWTVIHLHTFFLSLS